MIRVLLVWTWLVVFVWSIIVTDENGFETDYKYNDAMQKKTIYSLNNISTLTLLFNFQN